MFRRIHAQKNAVPDTSYGLLKMRLDRAFGHLGISLRIQKKAKFMSLYRPPSVNIVSE